MPLEWWKTLFEAGSVILLFLALMFGAGALFTSRRINQRQATRLRDFDKDLIDAKAELARQQERAAHAEHDATEAKKAADLYRLQIATANAQAAEADEKAEEEHLARVRLEEKLVGWKLDVSAQTRLVDKLKQYRNTPFDLRANPVEATFMEILDAVLRSAGWTRQMPSGDNVLLDGKARVNYASGITVEIAAYRAGDLGPAVEALVKGLNAEGIPATSQVALQESDPSVIHVVIGGKEL
jgi:hypothetical protein